MKRNEDYKLASPVLNTVQGFNTIFCANHEWIGRCLPYEIRFQSWSVVISARLGLNPVQGCTAFESAGISYRSRLSQEHSLMEDVSFSWDPSRWDFYETFHSKVI